MHMACGSIVSFGQAGLVRLLLPRTNGVRRCASLLGRVIVEARISVGSTREERQDLTLLPILLPAAVEHQCPQGS